MIVVTSGTRYVDIDAYACCAAYAELLNLLGQPAVAASSAVWNESITRSLRDLKVTFDTVYSPQPNDQFIIVDLSNPAHFDRIVMEDHVIEVIDHHPGFEKYWADKLGDRSRIEFIGAAATLVYEQWVAADKVAQMSKESAELLAAAILDNTLNFGAYVTTERDKEAYRILSDHADLGSGWAADYFTECQQSILADLAESLRNDTKFLKLGGIDAELCVGQLVVWDAKGVIAGNLRTLGSVLGGMSDTWMANVVSISDGRSYIIAENERVKSWAGKTLSVTFDGSIATAERLWLRKEIMKASGL